MRELKTYLVEGVVVRRRDFKEKDRILTLFTLERGRVDVLAKGARRPGSKLSYCSDLATVGSFKINSTRSLDIVLESKTLYQPEGAFGNIKKSSKIFSALQIVDNLYREGDSYSMTYNSLKKLIYLASERDSKFGFVSFLRNVIIDHGIAPSLNECVLCQKEISKSSLVRFSLKGGIVHQECARDDAIEISPDEQRLLQSIFSNDFSDKTLVESNFNKQTYLKTFALLNDYFSWQFERQFLTIE
ncbi:MAG: DNA repair protein RecO [candidate division WS2 bacterium ADurb.Bin280]|uniref:DNA repair protein RecO n=1 Tax=candidate division WS2 bacterium ADurb.Bin280 TaxID=1852829 RepID=A0A1V5SET6_9BACT|nr:MAG: DNA repair protein RecO [candidate division WS2 bacterium ADurb.Bin280]